MDLLRQYIYDLHYDTDKVKPPDWEVDWDDAPLPFKLYRGNESIPLSTDVPLTIREARHGPPDLRTVSHMLWYTYGITQYGELDGDADHFGYSARRFPPSGGALYPSELYVYLKLDSLPIGVYHYDAAHHRLILLREGRFDDYLDRATGCRETMTNGFGAIFVSTMFWKNYYKYNNFSYRLQGLDAGAVMGQLLEAAKRFGFSSRVHYQYLDRAIHHLLGLNEMEESVYAVVTLSASPVIPPVSEKMFQVPDAADWEIARELPPISNDVYVRSKRPKPFPMLIRMNAAARLESTRFFRRGGNVPPEETGGLRVQLLPHANRLSYDFAEVCRKRYSPELEFRLGSVEESQVAALLHESASSFSYQNDLDLDREMKQHRVSLIGCYRGCQAIPDGAYRYDASLHALRQLRPGDHRNDLQRALTYPNVNLLQVPLCLHVAGEKDHLHKQLGYRGYRIEQMEAGMLVQRVLLTATAMGMGARPLLGFDTRACERIYGIDNTPGTVLIQLPIGPCRPRARITSLLHA